MNGYRVACLVVVAPWVLLAGGVAIMHDCTPAHAALSLPLLPTDPAEPDELLVTIPPSEQAVIDQVCEDASILTDRPIRMAIEAKNADGSVALLLRFHCELVPDEAAPTGGHL